MSPALAKPPTLLCSASFPPNTGFAWDYIEGMYARIADALAPYGIRTLVGYPELSTFPRPLEGSAASPVALPLPPTAPSGLPGLLRFIAAENVRTLYLSDCPPLHWSYPLLRGAGVRQIVVHDHASGRHRAPVGLRRACKWAAARSPGVRADTVIAVSNYVARRQIQVGLMPSSRVVRVYNAVHVPQDATPGTGRPRRALEVPSGRPVIVVACRSAEEKGVQYLLRAFDTLVRERAYAPAPVLTYIGDGPYLGPLRALRSTLSARDDIAFLGYRSNARELVGDADLCVVPSTWEEAFGLSVAEPMALGKPVIATRVGGIPELVEDGITGLLVPPRDEVALVHALRTLLGDPDRARRMGARARAWVRSELGLERALGQLLPILARGFDGATRSLLSSRVPSCSVPPSLAGPLGA